MKLIQTHKNIRASSFALAVGAWAVAIGSVLAPSVHATIVDTTLTSTTQIESATNNPFFGAGATTNIAGVNLYFSHPIAAGSSLNGVFFDNINMGAPPVAPVLLTANQPGVTLTLATPGPRDNSERNQSLSSIGPDAAVLNTLAQDISYVGGSGFTFNQLDTFTFAGLGANQNVYVQTVGGDIAGWDGQVLVKANNVTVGTWTSTVSGPSLYGFNATTDATGNLKLDFSVNSGNYSGLAGIMVSGMESVPEPATWALSCLIACLLVVQSLSRRKLSASLLH